MILALPGLKALRLDALTWFLLPILLLTPGIVQAQPAPLPPSADIQRERVEQLQELLRTKKALVTTQKTMERQLAEFDARIAALEASLGVPSQKELPQGTWGATVSTAALASPGGMVYPKSADPGPYEPAISGRGGLRQKFRPRCLRTRRSRRHDIPTKPLC